jgi:type I restriction enzyme M protein
MTRSKNTTAQVGSSAAVLKRAKKSLRKQLGFDQVEFVEVASEPCCVVRLNGRPVLLVYAPSDGSVVTPAAEEIAVQLGGIVAGGPADYVWATTSGELGQGFMYCWLRDKECQVSRLPARHEVLAESGPAVARQVRPKGDPARFKQLQQDFDGLHERIYAAREPTGGSNDLTAELCKCIFLKMHFERHRDFRVPPSNRRFEKVFRPEYIRRYQRQAVEDIKQAFEVAKALPEYCFEDDQGRSFQVFEPQDFIKFSRPESFAVIADMLCRHDWTDPEATGLEDDILGRAFDIMLRVKFKSKGGMGIYLTPQPVRDAMVKMAFHDLLREDAGIVTRRDAKGQTSFRVCDPCCGSAGFLVTAMGEVRKHLDKLVGLTSAERQQLLSEILSKGFLGADSSPNMVLPARINMALHGALKARVFRVKNSLTEDVFLPESFDLILTNPPLLKGGITEEEQPEVLQFFSSDLDPQQKRPRMAGGALALAAKPDGEGVWKQVRSVDSAVLFIDRCLQLLKPGGRLMIVLPDGILCNSGDRYVREYLMGRKEGNRFVGGKAVVKAVVSLPPVTFWVSGTGAKTSFVYLQKKRPGDEQGPVFMAVANEVGFDVRQHKEVITGVNDLVKVVEAYKAGPSKQAACEPRRQP